MSEVKMSEVKMSEVIMSALKMPTLYQLKYYFNCWFCIYDYLFDQYGGIFESIYSKAEADAHVYSIYVLLCFLNKWSIKYAHNKKN